MHKIIRTRQCFYKFNILASVYQRSNLNADNALLKFLNTGILANSISCYTNRFRYIWFFTLNELCNIFVSM